VAKGTLAMTYGWDGNMLTKTGTQAYAAAHVGGYDYGFVANAHVSGCSAGSSHAVGAISDTTYCYDTNGNQIKSMDRSSFATKRLIQYSRFDKPVSIDSLEVGGPGHTTRYGYGPAREMAWRLDLVGFGATVNNNNASVEIQYFGGVERELRNEAGFVVRETFKRNVAGVMQITEERTYTRSSATGAYVAGTLSTIREEVMLKDHLGSTHLIIDADGTKPQYQRFDVWGMRADAATGSTQTLQQSYQAQDPNDRAKARTRKGYTGHEMVDGAGIVHMQGRIYDPKLGRFLQADPIVQDPLNAQSYNRYTYVFNNPLSLTDPSGYRSISQNLELYWKPIVAIGIAVYTGGQSLAAMAEGGAGLATAVGWAAAGGAASGYVMTGSLRGAVIGAFQGAATFGIGYKLPVEEFLYANIAAHMMLGGLVEEMNGGDFGHGMLTAGLSKVVGLGVDKIQVGDPMKIVIQAMAGGTVSELTGGDFANGAVSAAVQFAFNQLLAGESGSASANDEVPTALVVTTQNSEYDSGDWSDAAAGAVSRIKAECPKCVIARAFAANTDQFERALSTYVNISRVYIIGHCSDRGIYFGAGNTTSKATIS
jgi:RHS repeat-associated protein